MCHSWPREVYIDIDYQNRKAEYLEKFMAHIDWNEANARLRVA